MRSAKWIGPGECPVKSEQMHVDERGMIVIDGPESTVERLLRHHEHWASVSSGGEKPVEKEPSDNLSKKKVKKAEAPLEE